MSKEFKHYELKASKRPGANKLLSTTVRITGQDRKKYYCYVSFSDKLAEYVGKKLLFGISEFNPAFLHVDLSNNRLEVWACYVKTGAGTLLWSSYITTPPWLNFYPVKEQENAPDSSVKDDSPRPLTGAPRRASKSGAPDAGSPDSGGEGEA